MAFSCHLSMDLLCQDKMDACWESSESLGFPSFTVFRVPGRKEEVFCCEGSFFQCEAWPPGWGQF